MPRLFLCPANHSYQHDSGTENCCKPWICKSGAGKTGNVSRSGFALGVCFQNTFLIFSFFFKNAFVAMEFFSWKDITSKTHIICFSLPLILVFAAYKENHKFSLGQGRKDKNAYATFWHLWISYILFLYSIISNNFKYYHTKPHKTVEAII